MRTFAARPILYETVNRFPTAQIEVADAKVGTLRNCKGIPQRGEQLGFDVVENAWHRRVQLEVCSAPHLSLSRVPVLIDVPDIAG